MVAVTARFPSFLPAFVATAFSCPVAAQDLTAPLDVTSTGTAIGMAIFILLAVLIGLSVVAKLLIVFGIVPREAENGFHVLVHGAANVVGGLTKPRRRPDGRGGDR